MDGHSAFKHTTSSMLPQRVMLVALSATIIMPRWRRCAWQ